MRTAELCRRLDSGGAEDAVAWQLFGSLVRRGICDGYQVNAMRRAAQQVREFSRRRGQGTRDRTQG